MTYKELMSNATELLGASNVYTGFARVLMLELMNEKDMDMYALIDESADASFSADYDAKIDLLCQDIPLGHVLGYEWFYGYKIGVNEDVLIPRGETEELVGYVLADVDEYFSGDLTIADVACGSGAIGIALSKELNVPVYASDISEAALVVAKQNAVSNEADVEFRLGDMLEPMFDLKLDVLVCNPPYIKNTEHIQSSVLSNEPHVALFGGDDGLFFYRRVFENASKVMKERSMMAFEIGFDIGEAVVSLARSFFPSAEIVLKQDINGLDRMVFVFFGIKQGT